MAANGRLTAAELAPIAGGGKLRKDAAAAWNAFAAYVLAKHNFRVEVSDSYRPLGAPGDLARGVWSQWAAWERYQAGGNLAARPGTSNHGLGLALDLPAATRAMVDKEGAAFGFAKRWSDAPSESWHIKWKAGKYPAIANNAGSPTLKVGSKGSSVVTLKKLLYNAGQRGFSSTAAGKPNNDRSNAYFGKYTKDAVTRFQKAHRISPADGIVGPSTWRALRS